VRSWEGIDLRVFLELLNETAENWQEVNLRILLASDLAKVMTEDNEIRVFDISSEATGVGIRKEWTNIQNEASRVDSLCYTG
jgi:hypothetical protein